MFRLHIAGSSSEQNLLNVFFVARPHFDTKDGAKLSALFHFDRPKKIPIESMTFIHALGLNGERQIYFYKA